MCRLVCGFVFLQTPEDRFLALGPDYVTLRCKMGGKFNNPHICLWCTKEHPQHLCNVVSKTSKAWHQPTCVMCKPIISPVNTSQLEIELTSHPDRHFVNFLMRGSMMDSILGLPASLSYLLYVKFYCLQWSSCSLRWNFCRLSSTGDM